MVIALHNLARNYKLLPSEALERATTFDLYVLDVYNRRQNYEQELEEAKHRGSAPPPKKLSQEELLAMFNRVKERQKEQASDNKKNI
jgi:hypothetical protein